MHVRRRQLATPAGSYKTRRDKQLIQFKFASQRASLGAFIRSISNFTSAKLMLG